MGLKQDVVIVNEYSVPLPGGKGSRGGTPGSYVERYMARDGATESLAPIQRMRTDDFILRYMAREKAVERAPSRSAAKQEMREAQGRGGVAFGYDQVSLSDEQLRAASRDIQKHFESGKTVLKTVLSFDEDYLKKHGIVDQDFTLRQRGDYRGHLDQMKLRMAIMNGLDRMAAGSGGYDDLRYVGVIQVDTEHVHAHLAMVDAGRGQITKDGTQRGKLLEKHKSRLRRGIDNWLDEKQTVRHLSSAVGYERRSVSTYIKRWAHDRIRSESLPQFLLACLPEDRTLWRAGTNDPRMRKPNRLVTELVTEQLERPGSPMPSAMEKVVDYANARRERDGLATKDWQRLVDNGRDQILERAVNGVYGILKALPEEELRVRTPMLQVMSMDYERMATLAAEQQETQSGEDDLVSFGFRLRSYSSRLGHHKERATQYRELSRRWESAQKAGVADADSRPLYEFYRVEEDWHDRLRDKYQHFLPFLGDPNQWWQEQQRVAEYGQRLLALRALRHDATLQRMKDAAEAERLGWEIYDQAGGRHLTEGKRGRAVLDARIATMEDAYTKRVEELREELGSSGLQLTLGAPAADPGEQPVTPAAPQGHVRLGSGLLVPTRYAETADTGEAPVDPDDEGLLPVVSSTESMAITPGVRHDFAEVKALDLHHLRFDFASDVELGKRTRRTFTRAAEERRSALLSAMDYLDASGQADSIRTLPVDDVAEMNRVADDLAEQERDAPNGIVVLRSRIAELREQQRREAVDARALRRSTTTSLDAGVLVQVRERVDLAVREASLEPAAIVEPTQEAPERQDRDLE